MTDPAIPFESPATSAAARSPLARVADSRATTARTGDRLPAVQEIHDRDEWNLLVLQRPGYEIEQAWEWGDIRRDVGWIPYRYAAFAGSRCVGLASIASRRLPGLPYSILDLSRGPQIDADDDAAWRAVLGVIRARAERDRALFLRVSPGAPATDLALPHALARHAFRALPEQWTTWNPPRLIMTLRLEGNEEAVWRRCRKAVRQDVVTARRRGVVVRAASDGDMLGFHRLLVATARDRGYPVRGVSRLEALWRTYVMPGQGVALVAERDGHLLGGLLGMRIGQRACLQYAAIVRTSARFCHGPLLYWEFIRWAMSAHCTRIDWGGSGTAYPPQPADEGYSLYRFKAGFGSELRYYAPYHDLVFRPALYTLARTVEGSLLPMAWRLRAHLNH